MAYDNPIPGYNTPTTSNLRLWDSLPMEEFDLRAFNAGEYDQAMRARERAESISAVLYPNDSTQEGKELRLKQQYFFVAASIAVSQPASWYVHTVCPRYTAAVRLQTSYAGLSAQLCAWYASAALLCA